MRSIDVPEVVNLVFFKIFRSKTKFWQMVGRGTRLSKDLFGPGLDKEFFYIFDYSQNLEYFSQDREGSAGSLSESLSTKLFKARLELVGALDSRRDGSRVKEVARHEFDPESEDQVQSQVRHMLYTHVASMNLDNFVVRAKRMRLRSLRKRKSGKISVLKIVRNSRMR